MTPSIPFSLEVCRYGTRINNDEPAGGSLLHGGLAHQFENNRRQPVSATSHKS
jgi:hypothetical protein